ncbi:MAG: hypothetical protein EOP36_21040 [Rubrivivax sp.]|nr:MAG: hypothetical protein EOP36_21040 [Rubrivivax sp.]
MRAPRDRLGVDGAGNRRQCQSAIALLRMQPGQVGVGDGQAGVRTHGVFQVLQGRGGVALRQRIGAQVVE